MKNHPENPLATLSPFRVAATADADLITHRTPQKRRKLWELEEKHHCPLIGTCIPAPELRKIAHRFGFTASAADEFDTHVEAVNWSLSRNPVSEGLQRLLDKRYRMSLDRFAALRTDEAVRQAWKRSLASGQVAGPLWAVYSHKAASAETRNVAFADVHMLSHQVGAGQAADSRRLAELEEENAGLRRTLADERKTAHQRLARSEKALAESTRLLAERDDALSGLATLRRRLEAFESGQIMVDLGRRMMAMQVAHEGLVSAARRATELDEALATLRAELGAASKERDAALSELGALEEFLLAINRRNNANDEDRAGDCNTCPLGRSHSCVLYVGGRNSLVAQYRQLAERLGVRLLHHDGGLEQGLARLPELISGADAVLCPTDCISHVAYYQVKNHCKRSGKPCLFFKGSGVSGFACAMTRLARGEYSLGEKPAVLDRH